MVPDQAYQDRVGGETGLVPSMAPEIVYAELRFKMDNEKLGAPPAPAPQKATPPPLRPRLPILQMALLLLLLLLLLLSFLVAFVVFYRRSHLCQEDRSLKSTRILSEFVCVKQSSQSPVFSCSYIETHQETEDLPSPHQLPQNQTTLDCINEGSEMEGRSWDCCSRGWRPFQSRCYFISADKMSWDQSQQNCHQMGAHLVVISSDTEQILACWGA
ncbi:C-type lectin domain family 4 member A-like isoform X3 [Ornithorhynchus anatinus]|uniref:C-type lectin domain family 4 member A-like isoform X3 n=1 Tax=Ornithorhynchus anatinus TaxID=9258 RepID=UPI0010A81762|nr:C-type lectin domain family 4 member A-like isoform X3 [Ornithorhynchus anatinus]